MSGGQAESFLLKNFLFRDILRNGGKMDEEKKNCDKSSRQDDLSEKFLKTRTILFSGEVDKESAEKAIRQLLLLAADSDDPIRFLIDSPGGDVDAGFAVYDMIRFVKPKVYTIAMGLAASAGALILLAADKEHRFGLPNSHYLIHQPLSYGMRGVATEIEIHAKEIEKTKQKINEIIAEKTKKPLKTVEKDTDRDYWLNAAEAVEYGLIGRIIEKESDLP